MDKNRKKALRRNYARMFWIRAFLNLKLINIVLSIFYVSRGASLGQIFYLGVVWAVSAFLFEIPSSYMADRWGRKKTIMLGAIFMLFQWVALLFAQGFWQLSIAIFFWGLAYACMSGTDEALLYDTAKELGEEETTASKLGKFEAARNIFKIFTPIIGALIAKDLLESQFTLLLLVDVVGSFVSIILVFFITEPKHTMDLEKQEAGVMLDSVNLLKKDKFLLRAILNNELVFFAMFITWSFFQEFFVGLGITVLILGIGWGLRHGIVFFARWYIGRSRFGKNPAKYIHMFNIVFTVTSFVIVGMLFWFPEYVFILFLLYLFSNAFQSFTTPLFTELYHKRFNSYNRATTSSLAHILHNVIEIPLVLGAGILVTMDARYPFVFSAILALCVVLFLKLSPQKQHKKVPA